MLGKGKVPWTQLKDSKLLPKPHMVLVAENGFADLTEEPSRSDSGIMDREGEGAQVSWRFEMVLHILLNFHFLRFQNSLWFTTLIFRY